MVPSFLSRWAMNLFGWELESKIALHLSNPKPGGRNVRKAARKGQRFIPRLERLEDRLVPSWVEIGPSPEAPNPGVTSPWGNQGVTGRITSLAVDQVAGQPVLLVGSAGGGVFRTTNDFTKQPPTWEPLTDYAAQVDPTTGVGAGAIDVGSIALGPGNQPGSSNIYVGTGEEGPFADDRYGSGVLISETNGNSWTLSTGNAPNGPDTNWFFRHAISKVLVDPRNPQVLYAAVMNDGSGATSETEGAPNLAQNDGIYKSVDAGQTWSELTGNSPNGSRIGVGIQATDLDYTWDGRNQLTLFAGVISKTGNGDKTALGGVWRSTDGGNTWDQVGSPALPSRVFPMGRDIGRIALAVDHLRPGVEKVYAAVADNGEDAGHLTNWRFPDRQRGAELGRPARPRI